MMESYLIIIAIGGIFEWMMNAATCNGRVIQACGKPWESTYFVSSEKDLTLEQCDRECTKQCSNNGNRGFINEDNTVICYNKIEMFAHSEISKYQKVINSRTGEQFQIQNIKCSCGMYYQASKLPFDVKFSVCQPPISVSCSDEKICQLICNNYLVFHFQNIRGIGISLCKLKNGDAMPDAHPLTGRCYQDLTGKSLNECRCGLPIGTGGIANQKNKYFADGEKILEKRIPVEKHPSTVSPPTSKVPSPKPEKHYPDSIYVDEKHNVHTENVQFDECNEYSMRSMSLDTVEQQTNMQKCSSRCHGLYGHYDDALTLWCYNALPPAYGVFRDRPMARVLPGILCTCMVRSGADICNPICSNILPFEVNSERDCSETCSKNKGLVVLEQSPRLSNFRTTCFNEKSLQNLPLGFNIYFANSRPYCKCGRLRKLLRVIAGKDKRADVVTKSASNAINTQVILIAPGPVQTGQIKRTRSRNVYSDERKSKQTHSPAQLKELMRGKSVMSLSSDETNNNNDNNSFMNSSEFSKPTNSHSKVPESSLEKMNISAASQIVNNNNKLSKDKSCSMKNKFDVANSRKLSDPEVFKDILEEVEIRFPIETENIDFSWEVLLNSNTDNYGADYVFPDNSKNSFSSPNAGKNFTKSEHLNRSSQSNTNLDTLSSGYAKSTNSVTNNERTTIESKNNNVIKNSGADGKASLRSSISNSSCDLKTSKKNSQIDQKSKITPFSTPEDPRHLKESSPDSAVMRNRNVMNDKAKTVSRATTRVNTFEDLFNPKHSEPSTTEKLLKSAHSSRLQYPKNDPKFTTSSSHSVHSNTKFTNTIRSNSSTNNGPERSSHVENYPSVNIPSKWVHINKKKVTSSNELNLECTESLADDLIPENK